MMLIYDIVVYVILNPKCVQMMILHFKSKTSVRERALLIRVCNFFSCAFIGNHNPAAVFPSEDFY